MKFHFKNLDSIRSIAFLSTFFAHAFYSDSPAVLDSSIFKGASMFREAFGFGVPIFFVLSGFLITYLMFREIELKGKFNIKNFYARRFLRIWPLYYIVIIFGFVIFPFIRTKVLGMPYDEPASAFMYSLFLSNFDQIKFLSQQVFSLIIRAGIPATTQLPSMNLDVTTEQAPTTVSLFK